jgi:hypothetical protein
MAVVSRVLLPFVLVCLALLLEQSRADPADNSSTTSAATPTAAAQQGGDATRSSPAAEQKTPAKSPSIIKMLEGRENDLLLWASIAAVSFIIGWICGGNYYLRRDRTRRRKLRF